MTADMDDPARFGVDAIRPDAFADGHRVALERDVAWLAARADAFVTVNCPACAAGERRPVYEKYGMQHVSCLACETQYVSPRPTPDTLGAFYAGSAVYRFWGETIYPASAETRRERIFRPRAQIVDRICDAAQIQGGALVEIGAAYGLFCDEVRALNRFDRIVAVEPVPSLAETCRSKGFEVIETPFEHAALDGMFDLACSFEVIEHLFSPIDFMTSLFSCLRSNGYVVLSCPNIAGFDTLTLGRVSDTIDHEHLNYFSPSSLRHLAERAGFEDVVVTTPGALDVELVARAVKDGRISRDAIGPFLSKIVLDDDGSLAARFQTFLSSAGLSSSMLLVARKP